jgi:hypothetical protein
MKSSDVSKPNYAETLRRRKIDFKSYVLHTFEEGTLEDLKKDYSFTDEEEEFVQSILLVKREIAVLIHSADAHSKNEVETPENETQEKVEEQLEDKKVKRGKKSKNETVGED